MSHTNRRQALKKIGALTVAGSLAGCAGNGNGNGNGNGTGNGNGNGELGEPVEPLRFLTIGQGDAPERFEWANLVTEQVEELGFEVDLQGNPIDPYVERLYDTLDWELLMRRSGDGYEPASTLRQFFHSDGIVEGGGGQNVHGFDNEELDQALENAMAATSFDEYYDHLHRAQEILVEEHPVTPLLVQDRVMPYNTDELQNPVNMLEDGLGNFWNFNEIEPADGDGHIRTAMAEDLIGIHPLRQESRADREMIRLIYDTVLKVTPDLEAEPWAASEINEPDDTTVEVVLRDDLEFHDGEPVTAEDVKFSMEFGAEHSGWVSSRLTEVEDIEVVDDQTVVFNLAQPSIPFKLVALSEISIIPKHIWEEVEEEEPSVMDWQNPEPIGSGPFEVDGWDIGEEARLSANNGHFDPPNVDRVTRRMISDLRAGIRAFEAGDLNMITWELPPDDIPRFEEDDSTGLIEAQMVSIHYFGYQLRNEPTNNKELRRALAHAVPKQDIIDIVYDGYATQIDSPVSRGFPEAYNDDVETFEFDLDEARNKLEQAGFVWDDDGRIHHPPN